MRYNLLFVFLLYTWHMLPAQEIKLTAAYADSVRRMDWEGGSKLRSILAYNDAVKLVGYTDTVIVHQQHGRHAFYYHDQLIRDISSQSFSRTNPISIRGYAHPGKPVFIHSSSIQTDSTRFELLLLDRADSINDIVIKLENYLHDVLHGPYEKRTMSGIVLEQGQYYQVDSVYTDSIYYFDNETYEDILQVFGRTKYAKQCGTWKYYSPQGRLLRTENHGECRDRLHSLASKMKVCGPDCVWGSVANRPATLISTSQPGDTAHVMSTLYARDLSGSLLEHYLDGYLIGRFEKRSEAGVLLEEGYYHHIIATYQDTTFDVCHNLPEDPMRITTHTKFAAKCGTWTFYSPGGALLRREDYGECNCSPY